MTPLVVYIMILHFNVTFLGTTLKGEVIPDDPTRDAYSKLQDCIEEIPAVRARYSENRIRPEKITCAAFSVK